MRHSARLVVAQPMMMMTFVVSVSVMMMVMMMRHGYLFIIVALFGMLRA